MKDSRQPSRSTSAMASAATSLHESSEEVRPHRQMNETDTPHRQMYETDSSGTSEEELDLELERTNTRLSRIYSIQSRLDSISSRPLPEMGQDRNYPRTPPEHSYLVEFEGPKDEALAVNWTRMRKLRSALPAAYGMFCLSWNSACVGPTFSFYQEQYHIGEPVAALSIALYVFGFAAGPVIFGPLSEAYGRKVPAVISAILLTCFTFGAGASKDVQTMMLCRFFSGLLGSSPATVSAAVLSDLYATRSRGNAMTLYALTSLGGPCLSPVASAYMAYSPDLGWRWALYVSGILAASSAVFAIVFQEETYSPTILKARAREIRERTHNWAIHTVYDAHKLEVRDVVERLITRPLKMLLVEPILMLLCNYVGLVFGVLYMSLAAIPIVYDGYSFKGGTKYLPFVALFIGCVFACATNIFIFEPKFRKDIAKAGTTFLPEARLPLMMVGAVFFCMGIFWVCWAGAYPNDVHWIVPCIGSAFYGFGFLALFIPVLNYIVDSYPTFTASAMSANAFVRGTWGAVFPLFSNIMFVNLGTQWAGTLVGCIAALMLPLPFLFYKFGKRIRERSKFH